MKQQAIVFGLILFVGVPFYLAGYISARWGEQKRRKNESPQ